MKVLTDQQIKSHMAANLRRMLDSRGWSQSELHRRSGVNNMTISEVIRGETVPGIGVASRIADALDVTIDKLISAPPENSSRKAS